MVKIFCNNNGQSKEFVEGTTLLEMLSEFEFDNIVNRIIKYTCKGLVNNTSSADNKKIIRQISDKLKEEVENIAYKAFRELNSSGVVRIDFLIDDKKKKVYINEINSIPGSLAFYLWEEKGVNFTHMLEDMINIGVKDYKKRISKTHSFESNILQGFASNGGVKGLNGAKGIKR